MADLMGPWMARKWADVKECSKAVQMEPKKAARKDKKKEHRKVQQRAVRKEHSLAE